MFSTLFNNQNANVDFVANSLLAPKGKLVENATLDM